MRQPSRVRPPESQARRLHLSGEVKVGDILTIVTIMISLISVLVSWSIDRTIRLSREADDIRAAAARTLGELERWKDLSLSVYTEAQPLFVEASEVVVNSGTNASQRDRVQRARDLLWKRLNEARISISRKAMAEEIDNGYTGLFGYYPEIRQLYQTTLRNLRHADSDMHRELLARVERSMMSFASTDHPVQSADVGNVLRKVAGEVEMEHRKRLSAEMKAAESFLVEKIEADDKELLRRGSR